MKLSTKGRYGLKAMFELALHHGEGPMALKNIAENQEISEYYLEQLISLLRKSELVSSVRGAYGGYMLIDEPKKITVGSILRSLEGNISPVECVAEGKTSNCKNKSTCITKKVWERIDESISSVVDSTTLEDMLEEYREMTKKGENMYYI